MESLQSIKNRINGIASTRQITQSMRMVSTAKVKKAREAMDQNGSFHAQAENMVETIAQSVTDMRHIYFQPRKRSAAAVVLIAGDRGLCGGYNNNVCKQLSTHMQTLEDAVWIVTIGAKAKEYCRRRYPGKLKQSYTGMSEAPFYEDVLAISNHLIAWYRAGEISSLDIVSTQFASMLVQRPQVTNLLPLQPVSHPSKQPMIQTEPGQAQFLDAIVPFYLASLLYNKILEGAACEQSARITSMDAAVNNADEMIDDLTLHYNQARQGAITQEIIEIVSGASAVS